VLKVALPIVSVLITLASIWLLGMFAGTMADYYRTTRKQTLISLSFR